MRFRTFSPKQKQVLCWWCEGSPYASHMAILCDGAVRSGKTICMGLSFFAWLCYRFHGQAFAVCGKTIRSVKRNLLFPLLPTLRALGFVCRVQERENRMEISYGGRRNMVYFFGGKDEGSASLIQGMTLAGVFLDEVALMPRSFVEQALARCSVDGAVFWFNCNPESPHHWFYREWVCKAAQKNTLYLHFTMEDNPGISPLVRKRYESLYTGAFYERFILGKWVSPQGLVYPFMTIDQFCPCPSGPFSDCVVSCDYGTVNPASFGLWVQKGSVWYRIGEYYYDARLAGNSRTDEEHYTELERLAGDYPVSRVVVDPSAASFLEVIRRHGRFLAVPARNQVLDGIRKTGAALKDGRIRVCLSCIDAQREFGLYRWKDDRSRDAPVKEHDHAMDDIRYFVSTVLDRPGDAGCAALAAPRGNPMAT